MRRAVFLLLLVTASFVSEPTLAAPPPGDAPANPDMAKMLTQMCTQVVCRKTAHPFSLRSASGADAIQAETKPFPYLDPDGTLLIFPGETITLAVPVNAASLGKPRLLHAEGPDGVVDKGASSDSTLRFVFRETPGKPFMDLIVTSTVPLPVKYDAEIQFPGKDGHMVSQHSSICPLLPPQGGLKSFSGFENWQQPLVMLVIHDIRALQADAPRTCS